MRQDKTLLTLTQVARELNCSTELARKVAADANVKPVMTCGPMVLFDPAAVDKLKPALSARREAFRLQSVERCRKVGLEQQASRRAAAAARPQVAPAPAPPVEHHQGLDARVIGLGIRLDGLTQDVSEMQEKVINTVTAQQACLLKAVERQQALLTTLITELTGKQPVAG